MNFLDTYDISGPSTPTPERQQQEQSLNDEVTQVVGQLSRFWGGFRKQVSYMSVSFATASDGELDVVQFNGNAQFSIF